jgi:hypothetical protein
MRAPATFAQPVADHAACDNVNALNAPMANSGMSFSVIPPKPIKINPEITASALIP